MLTYLSDFNHPTGSLKGIIAAIYSLGAICALPFIPLINDRYGRRWCVFFGSCVMIVGAFLQGFSNGGAQTFPLSVIPRF